MKGYDVGRMNENCIFCDILAGRLPCAKVWEEASTFAFMDIGPLVPGHALVIPRTHYETLTDVPPATLSAVMAGAQRLGAAMMRAFEADGFNLHQANGKAAGQVVPHVHVHVVPRFEHDGHHWNWNPKPYASPGEMQRLAERLRAAC